MSLTMYSASVPAFLQILACQASIVDKAAAYASARKIEPSVLLNARLFPDMFPFVRQVQIACDFAKGASGRLAGVDLPSYPDTESSFDEVKARIAKTVAFIESLKPQQFDGAAERDITMTIGGQPRSFKGLDYLVNFAMPNFHFHATTAYAILRHNGVELGKSDFLMPAKN